MNFFNNILIFSLFFLICFIFKWLQISKRTNTVLSTLHSIITTLKNNSLSDTEKQQNYYYFLLHFLKEVVLLD